MSPSFHVGDAIATFKSSLMDIWNENHDNIKLIDPCFLQCRIDDNILLVFNIIVGKLAKISYLKTYEGTVENALKIGMSLQDVSRKFTLIYNSDENFYISSEHNNMALFFENPHQSLSENPDNKLEEITIYDIDLLRY